MGDGLPIDRANAIRARALRRRLAVYRTAPEATAEGVAKLEAELAALEQK